MRSWKDSIVDAISALGGQGHYQEIYAEVAARRDALPASWQAIIRRTIQQSSSDSSAFIRSNGDRFYTVDGLGHGRWGLRETPALHPTDSVLVAQGPRGSQGYSRDSVVRTAIERHAVRAAMAHFMALGARDIQEVGKPYDLGMTLNERDTHVEVKGSTASLDSVSLTRNEVLHARSTSGTQLFVVDQIQLTTDDSGEVTTEGGRVRIWASWVPSDESLDPTVYRHTLPGPQ